MNCGNLMVRVNRRRSATPLIFRLFVTGSWRRVSGAVPLGLDRGKTAVTAGLLVPTLETEVEAELVRVDVLLLVLVGTTAWVDKRPSTAAVPVDLVLRFLRAIKLPPSLF